MAPSASSPYSDDQLVAIQAVLDRVSSYQDGAPDGTVQAELVKALDEAGLEVAPPDVTTLAEAIEGVEEGDGPVQASDLLG